MNRGNKRSDSRICGGAAAHRCRTTNPVGAIEISDEVEWAYHRPPYLAAGADDETKQSPAAK